jgi:hypothetical protein
MQAGLKARNFIAKGEAHHCEQAMQGLNQERVAWWACSKPNDGMPQFFHIQISPRTIFVGQEWRPHQDDFSTRVQHIASCCLKCRTLSTDYPKISPRCQQLVHKVMYVQVYCVFLRPPPSPVQHFGCSMRGGRMHGLPQRTTASADLTMAWQATPLAKGRSRQACCRALQLLQPKHGHRSGQPHPVHEEHAGCQ